MLVGVPLPRRAGRVRWGVSAMAGVVVHRAISREKRWVWGMGVLPAAARLVGWKGRQPQAVADDEDAGESHGSPGERLVEQAEGGQWDGGDVVGERPEQVALDVRQGAAVQPDRVHGSLERGRARGASRLLDID